MPHKSKQRRAEYFTEYWHKNKHIKKAKQKQYWLKSKYNLTVEEYESLLLKYNYSCALCERPATDFKYGLAIDHCHDTGRVRGILCMPCNTSLGQLGDTEESMYKVINYLTNTGV